MKKTIRSVLTGVFAISGAIAASSFLPCGTTVAQETQNKFIEPGSSSPSTTGSPWSFSARSTFVSSYYYRGIQLYDGLAIQPSFGAFYSLGDWGTLGSTVWMQIPADDNQRTINVFDENGSNIVVDLNQKFFELDPTVSYDITLDKLTLSVGHIWYTDPGYGQNEAFVNGVKTKIGEVAPDTSEFYGGISYDMIGQPQFTVYADYRTLEYQYYSLGFSHTFEPPALGDGFNLTPFVVFGFASNAADDIKIYNSNGLEHINLGVSSSLKAGIFQVKPHFTYVFGTDDEENGVERTSDEFLAGVDLGYDF